MLASVIAICAGAATFLWPVWQGTPVLQIVPLASRFADDETALLARHMLVQVSRFRVDCTAAGRALEWRFNVWNNGIETRDSGCIVGTVPPEGIHQTVSILVETTSRSEEQREGYRVSLVSESATGESWSTHRELDGPLHEPGDSSSSHIHAFEHAFAVHDPVPNLLRLPLCVISYNRSHPIGLAEHHEEILAACKWAVVVELMLK